MENEIFKVGYVPYIKKERKIKCTSLWKVIKKHKVVSTILMIIFMATILNFVLMYNFLKLLETLS